MILIALAALTPFIFIPGLQDPSGVPKTFYLSLLALWAVTLLRKKESIVFPVSLAVFIGAIFLSAFWSINSHFYLSQLSLDLSGIALFLYAANCLKPKDLPTAIMIFCVMGAAIALSVFLGAQIDPRVSGPGWSVVNEKFFTLLLAGLIPLTTGLIFSYLYTSSSKCDIVGFICFVAMLVYILVVPSLATYFALGTMLILILGFFVWKWLKKEHLALLFIPVVLAVVILLAILFESKIHLTNMQERISWWGETAQDLGETYLLGVGRGQWQTQLHKRSPVHGAARNGWRPEHAHSDIVEIVGETGILGFGAFAAFIITTLLLRTGTMGLWLKLSLGVFLLEGLFWSLLHYAIFVPFIWMIAGMIWVDRKEETEFSGAGY